VSKPITVLREEFVEALVKLVNGSGLPMFAIESILKEIIAEVHAGAQHQYEMDKKNYEESKRLEELKELEALKETDA